MNTRKRKDDSWHESYRSSATDYLPVTCRSTNTRKLAPFSLNKYRARLPTPVKMLMRTKLCTRVSRLWRSLSFRGKIMAMFCGIILLACLVYYMLSVGNEIVLPHNINVNDYQPFEPLVTDEFPQGDKTKPKIPRIIHQTFMHTSIPPCFHDNVRQLVAHNPDWTYYLWTDATSRQYVADTHPELLSTFDGYKEPIRRADFIRYVALYEMGGVYADLDTISYRSLDVAITKYTCILPTEPFEHAALRAFVPYLLNNAIILCKPKHPFLKHILESLPRFEHMFKVLDATGPAFITTMFMEYNNLGREGTSTKRDPGTSNSPYFYKGELSEDQEDAVYIPNTQYFCNNPDPLGIWFFYGTCKDFTGLNLLERRACVNLKVRGMIRKPNKYAIIEHEFYRTYATWHFYNYISLYLYLFSKDIRVLVPHVKFYEGERKDRPSR